MKIMKKYLVHARMKYPAWNEREGVDLIVFAGSKAKAIKYARRQMFDDGFHGVIYYRAEEQQT